MVVCKNEETAVKRFGVENEGIGVCYTRVTRNIFNNDKKLENNLFSRINSALTESGFWEKHQTNWVCLDAELMPWSAKAQALLKDQYAAVGAAAGAAIPEVNKTLKQALDRCINHITPLLNKFSQKTEAVLKFVKAYQNYCWQVNTLNDYKLAPFHILATEGQVHTNKNHQWHMENITEICLIDKDLSTATPYKIVNFEEMSTYNDTVEWWLELTGKGGEGFVVKPYDFISYGAKGLLQPAVKCRGREYLRIIYGPEYVLAENLKRLKNRGLSRKQSLALREFALGIEGLERFIRKEPLRENPRKCIWSFSP